MLKDTPQSEALLKYLASPDAGTIWAHLGGFTSPNKKVSLSVYPDDISRAAAKGVIDAGSNVAYDMSDQAPAAFGGTAGSGRVGRPAELGAQPERHQRHRGQARSGRRRGIRALS